jgi:hypothetical protein
VIVVILTKNKNTVSHKIYLRPLGSSLSAQLLALVVSSKVTRAIAGSIGTEGTEAEVKFAHLTPELNPFAQRCLPRCFIRDFIFKGLTARRLYKSFGVKGLKRIMTYILSFK